MSVRYKVLQLFLYMGVYFSNEAISTHFLDLNQAFCGPILAREMFYLCRTYNAGPHTKAWFLKRKGVVEECCLKHCSRRYMMQYYCNQTKTISELSNIYGAAFNTNYSDTTDSPRKNELYQTTVPDTSLHFFGLEENKNHTIIEYSKKEKHHSKSKKVGKTPKGTSTKRNKCICRGRQRREKKNKAVFHPYSAPSIGVKNINEMYNWVKSPLQYDIHFIQ